MPSLLRQRPNRHHVEKALREGKSHLLFARQVAMHGWPSTLIYRLGGIGDDLLSTVIFRELHRRGRRHMWMLSRHPEIFLGNPDVDTVIQGGASWFENRVQHRIVPSYAQHLPEQSRDRIPDRHIIVKMCQAAGVAGRVELRPYLYLTKKEKAAARRSRPTIAVQSGSLSAAYPMETKQWSPLRMQSVVDGLAAGFEIVQLGTLTDPPLCRVTDLRGQTTLRQAAAILSQSRLFIGLVGFFMHLARAVECPAVIVYGGRELPSQSGYNCFENIVTSIECSPCWLWRNCPIDVECMKRITAETVLAAAGRQLLQPRQATLPVDVGVA